MGTQRIKQKKFAIACLVKKLVFHTETCVFREYRILKISLFDWVKELTMSSKTRYGVYHLYLNSNTKIIFAIACLGKKFA